MSEWIDVNKETPDVGECLVQFKNGTRGVIHWESGDSLKYRHITHWMRIPPVQKPDPFEEWWRQQPHDYGQSVPCWVRLGWNAGVKWARENKE